MEASGDISDEASLRTCIETAEQAYKDVGGKGNYDVIKAAGAVDIGVESVKACVGSLPVADNVTSEAIITARARAREACADFGKKKFTASGGNFGW